jgi:hypothetical protein
VSISLTLTSLHPYTDIEYVPPIKYGTSEVGTIDFWTRLIVASLCGEITSPLWLSYRFVRNSTVVTCGAPEVTLFIHRTSWLVTVSPETKSNTTTLAKYYIQKKSPKLLFAPPKIIPITSHRPSFSPIMAPSRSPHASPHPFLGTIHNHMYSPEAPTSSGAPSTVYSLCR